jgi:hypothetical protein
VFAAAAVLIADFTTLVYNVLGGELTVRFLLKVAAIALIAGMCFAYYLGDLRLEDTKAATDDPRWKRALASVAIASVVAVVIAGFFAIGPRAGS